MTTALITTYNEEQTIEALVESVKPYVDRVLVVDDPNTSDFTELFASLAGAETLVPDVDESGIGPCLLAGLRRCRGEWVVVLDAGGSHDPSAIPMMRKVDADVVVGSRFVPGAGYEGRFFRSVCSRLYSFVCNRRFGTKIHDWTSGFRVYSPSAVRAILSRPPTARMHGFQPQSLAACLDKALRVKEYPITYRAGRSSLDTPAAREAITWLVGLRCL